MAETIANRDVSRVLGKLNEWWDRMAQAGLTFDNLQTPITDTAFRKRLVDFWLTGGTIESSDQVQAREVMGDHFYGIGDLIRYFKEGFELDESPLSENYQEWLAQIPFSEQQLDKYSKTHILFPGYRRFNINNLLGLNNLRGFLKDQDLDVTRPYMWDERLHNRWYLLRLRPLPGSELIKVYKDQEKILPSDEEIPSACVVAMGMAYYFLRHNHFFPYTGRFLRCKDTYSGDNHVCVGIDTPPNEGKFVIPQGCIDDPHSSIGLATMVKLPKS